MRNASFQSSQLCPPAFSRFVWYHLLAVFPRYFLKPLTFPHRFLFCIFCIPLHTLISSLWLSEFLLIVLYCCLFQLFPSYLVFKGSLEVFPFPRWVPRFPSLFFLWVFFMLPLRQCLGKRSLNPYRYQCCCLIVYCEFNISILAYLGWDRCWSLKIEFFLLWNDLIKYKNEQQLICVYNNQ